MSIPQKGFDSFQNEIKSLQALRNTWSARTAAHGHLTTATHVIFHKMIFEKISNKKSLSEVKSRKAFLILKTSASNSGFPKFQGRNLTTAATHDICDG
ncbi:MAG: hypothetical protein GC192_13390 [Bacteroidetes bacterium]|nr:hypothetical protein [Bacteroidota bacterium]